MKQDSKSDLRICRVITRLNIGGPSHHAILLTEAFNQNGVKSRLISGTPSPEEGDFHGDVLTRGIPFHQIRELRRELSLGRDAVTFWKLLRLFVKEKPQIVHTHMAKAGALGRIAAWIAGVPVRVHTYHGHVFQEYFNRPKTLFFLGVERLLARTSHCLIAVSEHVRKELSEEYRVGSSEKIRVIPLGLEIEPFLRSDKGKGEFRRELGLDESALLVGIVGRLVPVKDHSFFLSVASALLKKYPTTRFVVVGDGILRKELEAKVREKGLEGHVWFLGWRRDLEKIYPDLDVVVLTSKNEGTPVSLIEAMAAARPVVAARVGGVPDVVRDGETGFLAPPGDEPAFCDRIGRLLDDPESRIRLGEKGREWVRVRYSKERLISDMKTLYEELLEKQTKEKVIP